MFLSTNKSAGGYYGMETKIDTSGSDNILTYAIAPSNIFLAAYDLMLKGNIEEKNIYFKIKNGSSISFFTVEEIGGKQWALCSYTGSTCDDNGNLTGQLISNQFFYVLASRVNLESIRDMLPMQTMKISTGDNSHNDVVKNSYGEVNESSCEAWIALQDTWLMDNSQVMLNSCDQLRDNQSMIADNQSACFCHKIEKGSIVSAVSDSSGKKAHIETLGPNYNKYLMVSYNGKIRYAYIGTDDNPRFQRCDGVNPLLKLYRKTNAFNPYIMTETIKTINETCYMDEEQVTKYTGTHASNKSSKNYTGICTVGSSVKVVGYEIINGIKFYLVWNPKKIYIPYDAVQPSQSYTVKAEVDNTRYDSSNNYSSSDDTDITVIDLDSYDFSEYTEKKIGGNGLNEAYEVTLNVGQYPDKEGMLKTGAAYLEGHADNKLPSDWGDNDLVSDSLYYNLGRYHPTYNATGLGGHVDNRHLNKINRFKFIPDGTGLSTKSFIFMTKPDLNLYQLNADGSINYGVMNSDLKKIPEFKYIARNKDVGFNILDSLEYCQTYSGGTPWLSVITNQAQGYQISDRELNYTEVGETFHGHKVIYGKHSFKHNIGGTVSIPFYERRDLSLYYTLKLWTEYIHCINLGITEPNPIHVQNFELDYAVSLYYIQTDETMENIIYWEKLTGVFPIKCPDSIFSWNRRDPNKDMEYDIEFIYSMRSVLKTTDLYELNSLYEKNASLQDTRNVADKDFLNDIYNNRYISKMAAYFGINQTSETDEFGNRKYERTNILEPGSSEFDAFVNNLTSGTSDISKYFCKPFTNIDNIAETFLPNYVPEIQSHGIPYVKGPYIAAHPDYNGGKYLLKWV